MFGRHALLCMLAILAPVSLTTGHASEDATGQSLVRAFWRLRAEGGLWLAQGLQWLSEREAVEFALAVAESPKLGPNTAWYHASRSRYDWDWLAARFDKAR